MKRGAPGGRLPGAERTTCAAIDAPSVADAYDSPVRRQQRREKARRVLVLGSIRAHLAEQPSRACLRAAARQWEREIWALVGELERELAA